MNSGLLAPQIAAWKIRMQLVELNMTWYHQDYAVYELKQHPERGGTLLGHPLPRNHSSP